MKTREQAEAESNLDSRHFPCAGCEALRCQLIRHGTQSIQLEFRHVNVPVIHLIGYGSTWAAAFERAKHYSGRHYRFKE